MRRGIVAVSTEKLQTALELQQHGVLVFGWGCSGDPWAWQEYFCYDEVIM